MQRQQQHGEQQQENQNIVMPRGLRRFDKNEIVQLTNNFNESRIVGQGSFGNVYRGIDNSNPEEPEYAIKVLSDELRHGSTQQQQFGERTFANELHALTRFNHPSIVNIVGYCQHNNERYIIYTFLRNGTLHEKLRDENDPLQWHQRLHIACTIATAIHHMHEKGVFHRDIKSPNICFGENFEIPKIIDCGIASLLPEDRLNGNQSAFTRQSFTVTSFGGNGPVYTDGYGPPEYLRNPRRYGPEQEIFSFGVVLLELLTGRDVVEEIDDEKEYLYTVKVEKGVFGIAMSKIKGSERGSVVGAVKEKTQAIKLGIQKGDYIIKLMEFDQSLGTYLHRVCEAKRMVL